ncbi:MAG TPA: M23 family metallopeptidase [Stellaceae bacterium]
MKSRISLVLGLMVLVAGCAQQPDLAPVTRWGGGQSSAIRVRVVRGDTLFGIARRYNLPVRLVIDANGLISPYRLEVGTILTLPGEDAPMPRQGVVMASAAARPRVSSRAYEAPPAPHRSDRALASSAAAEERPRIASSEGPPSDRPTPRVAEVVPVHPQPPAAVRPAAATFSPPPAAETGRSGVASARGFIWPVHGRIVESYGIAANGTHNDGINIAARAGSPVYAAQAGEVVYVGNELRGYGNLVLIKHEGGYITAYAHNSALLVHKGEHVARGQTIARVGATGEVGQPQLHFEVRAGRNPVDPTQYLPPIQQATAVAMDD